jgi:predicted nucleic acid-binding protein
LTLAVAGGWIKTWLAFESQPIDLQIVSDAIALAQRYQISYYDAQIIAAAKRIGAKIVYSEDLNNGQSYNGVQVINPFQ